jgi:hypothetical protein
LKGEWLSADTPEVEMTWVEGPKSAPIAAPKATTISYAGTPNVDQDMNIDGEYQQQSGDGNEGGFDVAEDDDDRWMGQ